MISSPNCFAYEHLSEVKKDHLTRLAFDNSAALNYSAIDEKMLEIIKRRSEFGESLELEIIVKEGVHFLESKLGEQFREQLYREIISVLD